MKKALALMLVLLVGGIAFISFFVWYKSDRISYRTDIVKYAGVAEANEGILATYQDQTTSILGPNVDKLIWALTVGEANRTLQLFDRETPQENISIQFDDKLSITIWPTSADSDEVFIRFRGPGRSRQYTLEGYKSMEWLLKIISPEGYWGPNELVAQQI